MFRKHLCLEYVAAITMQLERMHANHLAARVYLSSWAKAELESAKMWRDVSLALSMPENRVTARRQMRYRAFRFRLARGERIDKRRITASVW